MNVVEASGLGYLTRSLILLSRGQVRLAGQVDDLPAAHRQASLEDLAMTYLRETTPEVTR